MSEAENETERLVDGAPNCSNYGTQDQEAQTEPTPQSRVYARRWVMLAIFCSYSATNAFQWNQYATISDIMIKFYNQPAMIIDLMIIIYLVLYVILILPVNWFLDKYGLRATAILAAGFNAAGRASFMFLLFGAPFTGAWLKFPGAVPQGYWFLFGGQIVASISNACLLGIPAQQAAVWFGAKEVAMATAVGVLGNQFGIALGFLLPPLFVHKPDPWDPIKVEEDMRIMTYVTGIVTTVQFIIVFFAYQERPPSPPSRAQALACEEGMRQAPLPTLKTLFRDKSFVLLFISYGLNTGAFYTITTVLNNMVIAYYKDAQEDIGYIGLLLIVAGMAGSIIIGYWLDRTHKYRQTTIFMYFMSFLGTVAFMLSLVIGKPNHIWLLYITGSAMGLFMTGYLPLGFEFAAEITYPISEGMTSGLLNASAMAIGTALILCVQLLMDEVTIFNKKSLSGLLLMCMLLLIGLIMTVFIKERRKRQRTETIGSYTAAAPSGSFREIEYDE